LLLMNMLSNKNYQIQTEILKNNKIIKTTNKIMNKPKKTKRSKN